MPKASRARSRRLWLIALVAVLAVGGVIAWNWLVESRRVAPAQPHEALGSYDGIALGMSMDAVMRAKGFPPTVFGLPRSDGNGAPIDTPVHLDPGPTPSSYDWWRYGDAPSGHLDVFFSARSQTVSKITCESQAKNDSCPHIYGVAIGSTATAVHDALGAPEAQDTDASGVKTMSYPRYALELELKHDKVSAISAVKMIPLPSEPAP